MNNYYKVLNLNGRNIDKGNLTDEQVRIAYEKMRTQSDAMKVRARTAKEIEEIQKLEAKIQEAYYTLETKEKRAKYNVILEQETKQAIPQEKGIPSRKPVFSIARAAVSKKISGINPDKLEEKSERQYIDKIKEIQKEAQRNEMRVEPKQELQFMPLGKVKKADKNERRKVRISDRETEKGLKYLAIQREEGEER